MCKEISGLTVAIRHTRQTPRHELQTAFAFIYRLVHLPQVINVEQPACLSHDDHVCVASLSCADRRRRGGGGRSEVVYSFSRVVGGMRRVRTWIPDF